jgi:peptide/nickel transport system substrate-binding protein
MKFKHGAKVALAVTGAAVLAVSVLTPASASTRTTVIVHSTNSLTSFNSSQPDTNLTINGDVGYLSGAGFNYYDNKKNLVKNPIFGSYKITKNTATDFRVAYTVNKGLVWSDGTPINGVDLLLSHVLSSNEFSKDAKLGDPESDDVPAFDSNGYSGTYSDNIVGEPVLSGDKMTVTLQYKARIADWDLYGPGPSPVHALVHLAEGKKGLQSVSANEAARDKFLAAFTKKDSTALTSYGKIWSTAYDITSVDDSTNELLFVGNGGFTVSSAVTKQSVTLKVNPKYNSGPKLSGTVQTIIFKFISDGTAATQALANGELDLYAGQVTADGAAALKKVSGITVEGSISGCYEHWDTRFGTNTGEPEYTGLFSNALFGAKAKDMRKAFLLSVPRAEINEKLIHPVNPTLPVLNSTFTAPGQDVYDKVSKVNGSAYYTGSQEALNRKAVALIKKHYPTASPSNPVTINVLVPGNNPRRAAQFALAKANAAKNGLNLVGDVQAAWGTLIGKSKYDATFFAYCPTSSAQASSNANFKVGGGNNRMGVNLPALDKILDTLQYPMSRSAYALKVTAAERIIHDQGLTVGVFQHPEVTAYQKELKGIKQSPFSPALVWNYWEWSY